MSTYSKNLDDGVMQLEDLDDFSDVLKDTIHTIVERQKTRKNNRTRNK